VKDVERTRLRFGPQSNAAKIKSLLGCDSARHSENRGAFILLSPEEGGTAVLRNSPNARDISEDANLQDMRRQIVADTWRNELVRSSIMKMEVSGFPKISYFKIIPEDRNI
jgi:hypothetical protein